MSNVAQLNKLTEEKRKLTIEQNKLKKELQDNRELRLKSKLIKIQAKRDIVIIRKHLKLNMALINTGISKWKSNKLQCLGEDIGHQSKILSEEIINYANGVKMMEKTSDE